jgi:hypothetical protein
MQDTGQRAAYYLRKFYAAVRPAFPRRHLPYIAFAAALMGGLVFGAAAVYSSPDPMFFKPDNPKDVTGATDDTGRLQTTQTDSSNTIHVDVSASSQGSNAAQTDVMVNGQPVQVPANGSVHKDITSEQGTASVDVSQQSSTSSGNSSSTSFDLHVDNTSSSSTTDDST